MLAPSAMNQSSPAASRSSAEHEAVGTRDDDAITCQRCRNRKKKCDKLRPRCTSCQRAQIPCVYEAVVTDRSQQHHLLGEIARLRSRCKTLEYSIQTLSAPSPQSPAQQSPALTGLPERILVRLMVREADSSASLSGSIGQQLGTPSVQDGSLDQSAPYTGNLWPPRSVALSLIEQFYTRSAHQYMPVFNKAALVADVFSIYPPDEQQTPDPLALPAPDIRIFRLSAIFGSVTGLEGKSGSSFSFDLARLQALAMTHAPAIFRADEISCMAALCLLVFLATVQFSTMNPYDLVGIVAQVSNELHYECEAPWLPFEVQEQRRRIFWSLYCLDRMLSALLQKPFWIPENTIQICLPLLPNASSEAIDQPGPFFHHLVALRRLQGHLISTAFLSSSVNPEADFVSLRNQIDKWYESASSSGSHLYLETMLELHYNILLCNLYRPSRLCLRTFPSRMPTLRKAACRVMSLYHQLASQQRMPHNYVHLNSIVTVAMSLLYALGEFEGDVGNLEINSWRTQAFADIASCELLFNTTCDGWPGIQRFRQGFAKVTTALRGRLDRPSQTITIQGWTDPSTVPAAMPTLPSNPTLPVVPSATDNFPAINPDVWLWGGESSDDPPIDVQQLFASSDIDAVLSSFGFPLSDPS